MFLNDHYSHFYPRRLVHVMSYLVSTPHFWAWNVHILIEPSYKIYSNYIRLSVCAAPPGPLTGCAIRLPKDQERHAGIGSRHHHHHHQHHHQRRTSPVHDEVEDKDLATISCTLDNDGGVRPLTYSLEIYESNDLTTSFYG